MLRNFRRWLADLPIADPLERQQAGLLQAMLLVVLSACVIGQLINLASSLNAPLTISAFTSYPLILLTSGAALAMLRRGRFAPAVGLSAGGIILVICIVLLRGGLDSSGNAVLALAVPITMAGLLLGRRGVLLACGLCITLVTAIGILQTAAPELVGLPPPSTTNPPTSLLAGFILIVVVLGLFLDRFGSALYSALEAAHGREEELDQLRAGLEQTVAERTAALQRALQEVEQREMQLRGTLEELNESRTTVRELSAPIIPVLPGVLVAPLVGVLDEQRIAHLNENLLREVERQRARRVILDVTGVPVVDTQMARTILHTASAVRLLGAHTVLVGIRPEVAQTIVSLGADLSSLPTYSDLREAVQTLITRGERVAA